MKKTSNVKRYHVWHASLLLFMIALIMIGGIFEISHSPTLDSQIMPHKPLFDHSQYQYHPPEPRHEEWGIGHDPECGSGPSFDWFFQNLSNPNHRSVNNEDKTIYNTLFQRAIPRPSETAHIY